MFRSPEILFRDLNRLSWIQDLLDYTPWKHASYIKNNKRVQTVKMAVKYKKRVLCQTNILPFLEFYGSQKQRGWGGREERNTPKNV